MRVQKWLWQQPHSQDERITFTDPDVGQISCTTDYKEKGMKLLLYAQNVQL